ncbi:sodium-dependent transporter [Tichowtungia aerotolerans]|uniref:Sodium-dependent transporter n=1 Tax=Tichowtungia aerotolerans TaxID=2697043 RepID=A0A6P1M601_9BACT|nr:sodium-dependent transporter [Tichowtungia aerotolerans]QHI69261.1 sodium-dependent transporter [Tichowtungia aerotolerans]
MAEKRSLWGSKIGFLLAAIGSAVGLGNIWRFSYMAYENGGGAFLIPYLVALLCAGVPLMILEYSLGHREKASPPLAFARINPLWEPLGWWMPVVAFFGINLFYAAVIGWCINYFGLSLTLGWGTDTQSFFFGEFLQLSDSPFTLGGIRWPVLAATAGAWAICWTICYREVSRGIEKASMIFMPLLVILTLILVGWSLRLDGAREAIREFYLKADLSKIALNTAEGRKVWVAAFGQIFFTLSLGFGIMITYASYLPKKTDITGNALTTCILNCLYSIIAGFAVFGTIGFMANAKGVPFDEAITSGPGLAFVVYPEAINQLPILNQLFGALFFLVLIVAGISSMISLTEAFSCSICDKFVISRQKATTIICSLGLIGSIPFTTRAGLLILDIADHFINNYALIIGGILECILIGWLLKSQVMRRHVNNSGGIRLWPVWDICIRVITPAVLLIMLVGALLEDFTRAYGAYPIKALLLFGGGILFVTRLLSFILSHVPWRPEKLKTKHHPEDENLLT